MASHESEIEMDLLAGPIDPRHEIAQNTVRLVNRLRQSFPAFFEDYSVSQVEVNFSEPLSENKTAITTLYDGTTLVGIHINPMLTSFMYKELDEVLYADLVRTNIGIAVCLDAVFQKLLGEDFYDPRVTEALESMLIDHSTPLMRLKEVFGFEADDKAYVEKAWGQTIQDQCGGINTDLLARINAQRLAFGMVIASEEDKYGAEESISMREASRHYLIDRIRNHARKLAFVGYALTGNMNTSVNGATKQLLSPEVIPFAIPFTQEDLSGLIGRMRKAQRSFDFPYDEARILDLSDAIFNPGPI